MNPIQVTLADEKKWNSFHPHTEMIVTKKKGRCLFPHLDYKIIGLDKHRMYTIQLHLERVDGIKYKFDQGEWKEAAKGDPILPVMRVQHPDGARPGDHWMENTVSFSGFKITNDPKNPNQKLVLVQSMHKYQPVLTITRIEDMRGEEFRLRITEFMVVTAYQSEEVIRLKVENNKFASGFRSNGGKRRNSDDSDSVEAKRTPFSDASSSSSNTSPVSWNSPTNFGVPTSSSSMYSSGFSMMNPMAMHTPFSASSSSSSADSQLFNNFDWSQFYGNQAWFTQNQHNIMNTNMWNTNMPAAQNPVDAAAFNPFGTMF